MISKIIKRKKKSVIDKTDNQQLIARITQIIMKLNSISQEYDDAFLEFMNIPKIREYLFNKPVRKFIDPQKGFTYACSYYIRDIHVDDDLRDQLMSIMFPLLNYRQMYETYYRSLLSDWKHYQKLSIAMPDIKKRIPYIPRIHTNITIIAKVLSTYKRDLYYVPQWSFFWISDGLNFDENAYQFSTKFNIDFYGLCINKKNSMVQFSIIYDSTSKQFTEQDLFIQYMLCQMNIHTIRLNKNSNFRRDISAFIKKISSTNEYQLVNGLNSSGIEISTQTGNQFYDSYRKNYLHWLKNYDESDQTNDVNELDSGLIGEHADQEFTVSNKDMLKFLKRN